jgi:hypothetical protein
MYGIDMGRLSPAGSYSVGASSTFTSRRRVLMDCELGPSAVDGSA